MLDWKGIELLSSEIVTKAILSYIYIYIYHRNNIMCMQTHIYVACSLIKKSWKGNILCLLFFNLNNFLLFKFFLQYIWIVIFTLSPTAPRSSQHLTHLSSCYFSKLNQNPLKSKPHNNRKLNNIENTPPKERQKAHQNHGVLLGAACPGVGLISFWRKLVSFPFAKSF